MHKKKVVISFFIFLFLAVGGLFTYLNLSKKDKKQEKKPEVQTVHFFQNRVVMTIRQVFVWRGGEKKPVKIGDLLQEEDEIETLKGSAIEMMLENRFKILIRENTKVSIKALKAFLLNKKPQNTSYFFNLTKGKVFVQIKPLSAYENFQIHTPTLAVGVRGTQFMVFANKAQTKVKVWQGSVLASRNIDVPKDLKEQTQVIIKEQEQAKVSAKENQQVAKQIQTGKLDLPQITKEKLASNDPDFLYSQKYFSVSSNHLGGLLELTQTQEGMVFLNQLPLGQGDLSRYLLPGKYFIKVETPTQIFEQEIKIIAGEDCKIVPAFKAKELLPQSPSRKPQLMQ